MSWFENVRDWSELQFESVRDWSRRRDGWFWTPIILVSFLILWLLTEIARSQNQNVNWYTGFGQWLGALGSIFAAIIALSIATTDRRRADKLHEREARERWEDLEMEAGLVWVSVRQLDITSSHLPRTNYGVSIVNRRSADIFSLSLYKFKHDGSEIDELELQRGFHFPDVGDRVVYNALGAIHLARLRTDDRLVLFIKDYVNSVADFAAVRYTDSSGRRWQVDSLGRVESLYDFQ